MFYEKFDLEATEHTAEYQSDDIIITYFMQQVNSINQFIELVQEEWMHGLIDWCLEGYKKTTEAEDHYILREIGLGI